MAMGGVELFPSFFYSPSRRGVGQHRLTDQLAQKLLLVHVVLEGFAAVDEDHWDFVVKLTAEFGVAVDVDLAPNEAATARQLGKTFLHHFAEVASLPGIDDDGARF
jgi:hypothetical protein